MGIRDLFKRKEVRSSPAVAWVTSPFDQWISSIAGYHRLWDCPEIVAAVSVYAQLVSGATIQLMANTKKGDVRIKNELSHLIDISPNPLMTKQTFYEGIIRTLLMKGDGNQVTIPVFNSKGLIEKLVPLDPDNVRFEETADGYQVKYDGKRIYRHDEILHFRINPDSAHPWLGTGYKILLSDVVKSLHQSTVTKNTLLENPSPSIIVKVDGLTEEMATPTGRDLLTAEYAPTGGKPWIIPGEMMDVQQIKPLTLADLAIKDGMELDRREAAMMLGVPPFLVGVGDFNRDEFNNFIRTKVMWLSKAITQELTRQLLISPDWYFRQSPRSLYAYEIKDLADMGINLRKAGVMTGNEIRDLIDMSPVSGLDDLVMLENYIPTDMLGNQKKLVQEGEK